MCPHLVQLTIEVAKPLADAAPFDLDLGLAGTSAGADAAHLAVVVVGTDQARKQVVELSRLDLQAALSSAGVLREDVEDQLRTVDHPDLELLFEVALLPRAQVVVADQEVVLELRTPLLDLGHLAASDEDGGLDLVPVLDLDRDHLAAGGPGQLLQLSHLLLEQLGADARKQDPDQEGTLAPRSRVDQLSRSFRRLRIPGTGSDSASTHSMRGSRRSQRIWRRA